MSGESAFQVEGKIVESFANGTFRVELANGHRLLGFLTGRAKRFGAGLKPGDTVRLILSPYDLSEGRIILEAGQ